MMRGGKDIILPSPFFVFNSEQVAGVHFEFVNNLFAEDLEKIFKCGNRRMTIGFDWYRPEGSKRESDKILTEDKAMIKNKSYAPFKLVDAAFIGIIGLTLEF